MDPGLGLIVNSIVPTKCEEPTSPTKVPLQLPDGFLEKPHVRHALKYMPDDEQRERALEVALAWKQKFRAEQWNLSLLRSRLQLKKTPSAHLQSQLTCTNPNRNIFPRCDHEL
jgi:hypothetical protein